MTTLASLRREVERRAAVIDAPAWTLPTYGRSSDLARPHLEVAPDGTLAFVVVERGQELERRTTRDRDELLRWVFDGVTSSMAGDWEAAHRVAGEDHRRGLFRRQLELLAALDPSWAEARARALQPLLDEVGLAWPA